ncbi:hypothetical protein N0V90_000188 [Kalmusia sp. IMI 367209]|nr:hypothetical protein N0V90_000188 [Kalmusia sp. IMI 367209]
MQTETDFQSNGFSQTSFQQERFSQGAAAFDIPPQKEKRPAPPQPKKRIIICCDGTWQSSAHGTQTIPSNVAKMSRSIASWYVDENGLRAPQVVYYDAGVGTAMGWLEAKWTGAFGGGLDENVCEAYNFLVNNYSPGDEVFFFGFSRGAYTVRACAGVVCRAGICQPRAMGQFWEMYANYKSIAADESLEDSLWGKYWDGPPSKFTIKVKDEDWEFKKGSGYDWLAKAEKNVTIKVVGVWDTVGSLGYPDNVWRDVKAKNKPYGFHNTDIHPQIENAFHALALEEHRKAFGPTLWSLPRLAVHINVGGGSGDGMKDLEHGTDNPDGPKKVLKPGTKQPEQSRGDLEIMSVTTFFWMVDRCAPFLRFQIDDSIARDYARALDKIMQRAKEDPKHGHYGGWGIAPILDSYEGVMKAAGSEARTPGHYFVDRDHAHKDEHHHKQTNEYMHPVVEHARQQINYDPDALKGFKRKPWGPGKGHHWVKTYKPSQPGLLKRGYSYFFGSAVPSESEEDVVSIPEFVIPEQGWHENGTYWMPYERELIMTASNRSMKGGYMPPEEQQKIMNVIEVDQLKELRGWKKEKFASTNPEYMDW